MSSYTDKHKRYYETHKAEISAKESEKKRWKVYYEQNKERIKHRRQLRKVAGHIVDTAIENLMMDRALAGNLADMEVIGRPSIGILAMPVDGMPGPLNGLRV